MAKPTYSRLERMEEGIEDKKKKLKQEEMVNTIKAAVKSAVSEAMRGARRPAAKKPMPKKGK